MFSFSSALLLPPREAEMEKFIFVLHEQLIYGMRTIKVFSMPEKMSILCRETRCIFLQRSEDSLHQSSLRDSIRLTCPCSMWMTLSLDQQWGSEGKGKSILKTAISSAYSPTSGILPKVCSPVRCQVDDSNSQMCHAQLVSNRLSNRAINLAQWLLHIAASHRTHRPSNSVWWVNLVEHCYSPGIDLTVQIY